MIDYSFINHYQIMKKPAKNYLPLDALAESRRATIGKLPSWVLSDIPFITFDPIYTQFCQRWLKAF